MTFQDFFGEPISIYTREEALRDGVLVDVTELAHRNGFKVAPVAFTRALWAKCEGDNEELDTVRSRAAEVLWSAYERVSVALRNANEDGSGPFPYYVPIWRTTYQLWIAFNAAEGFTIGFPEDF